MNKKKTLKKRSTLQGKSMKKITAKLLETADHECLLTSHIPNEETLEAINNIESGKNLTEIKDLKELFKRLGI